MKTEVKGAFDVIKENYDEYDFFINVQGDIAVFNPREIDDFV